MSSTEPGGRSLARGEVSADVSSQLAGNLGTGGLLLTALGFNAPLAVMAGFVPVGIGLGLGAGTPLVYLIVMALMLLFAVGLVTMARHMQKPGAFYSYITAGLGRVPGLAAGFVALTSYILLGSGTYVLSGLLTQDLFQGFLHGPDMPWWFWSAVLWALVSVLTLFNIDVSTRVLGVFLCVEVLIVLFWDARVFLNGGPDGRTLHVTAQLGTGSIGYALLFAVACLTGFESIQVFRSETRNPDRTIPRATYLTVVLLAGFYALGSWAYLVGFGTNGAMATAATPTQSFLGSLSQYAGVAVRDVANVMLVTSIFAALLAVQNIAARYSFALGRDRVLPAWLGSVNPRHQAPTRAAAVIAVIVFLPVATAAVLGWNPVTSYVAMTGLSYWAIVLLLCATALAIVLYFRRHPGVRDSAWKTLLAPALAVVGFGYVLIQATANRSVLMGGNATFATWCIAAIVVVAGAAMTYGRWLRRSRPQTWQTIGDQDDLASDEESPVETAAGGSTD